MSSKDYPIRIIAVFRVQGENNLGRRFKSRKVGNRLDSTRSTPQQFSFLYLKSRYRNASIRSCAVQSRRNMPVEITTMPRDWASRGVLLFVECRVRPSAAQCRPHSPLSDQHSPANQTKISTAIESAVLTVCRGSVKTNCVKYSNHEFADAFSQVFNTRT